MQKTNPALKRCSECGEEYPLIFFRRNNDPWLHASSQRHSVCLACEQDAADETKRRDRWREKAATTIRRHAQKRHMTPQAFIDKYGWDTKRIAHIMQHASENTCCYCREPYAAMGHGPADITIDIIDPAKEPFLETNVQPCCATCNRRKGKRTPEDWAIILGCWRKHDRRTLVLKSDPLRALPLWEHAARRMPKARTTPRAFSEQQALA